MKSKKRLYFFLASFVALYSNFICAQQFPTDYDSDVLYIDTTYTSEGKIEEIRYFDLIKIGIDSNVVIVKSIGYHQNGSISYIKGGYDKIYYYYTEVYDSLGNITYAKYDLSNKRIVECYKRGKLISRREYKIDYKNDKCILHGTSVFFNEDGQVIAFEEYRNGKKIKCDNCGIPPIDQYP